MAIFFTCLLQWFLIPGSVATDSLAESRIELHFGGMSRPFLMLGTDRSGLSSWMSLSVDWSMATKKLSLALTLRQLK